MFSFVITLFLTTLIVSNHAEAASLHKFHSGDCPKIEAMSGFSIDRFLGQWYVLQSANDNVNVCLRDEFNASQESSVVAEPKNRRDDDMIDMARNELEHMENKKNMLEREDEVQKIIEKVYHVRRSYLPFGERQFINETGKVRFLKNDSQAEMEIGFPYTETGMLNMKHYEVIATDYDRYALIWRCQKTIFGHRRTAQLMSRYPSLEKKKMEELQALLRHFEAEYEIKFVPVRQTDCMEVTLKDEPSKQAEPASTSVVQPNGNTNKNTDKNSSSNGDDESSHAKNRKKLINIDVGGFHLSIYYPFWG